MSGQLDKFSSGSRSAKNAAGITRKDIINKTFTNMHGKFGCTGTKPAANLEITDQAGKCLGTRTISIDGKEIHVPVYEKGGDGCAADYAMAYIAGFNNGITEWPTLRNHMWFLLTERKFLEEEYNAWNNYQQNQLKKINDSFMKEDPNMFGGEVMTAEKIKDCMAPFALYFMEKNEQGKKNAKSPAEARKVEVNMFAHPADHLQEWMQKNGTNPTDLLKGLGGGAKRSDCFTDTQILGRPR